MPPNRPSASAPVLRPARERDYAAKTRAERIPVILRTAAEGQDAETQRRLDAIGRAIAADAPMLADLAGWPATGWEELPRRVNGLRPSQAPFFDFEYWFYLRLLQAVRFAERKIDPFRIVKHKDLARHIDWAAQAILTTRTLPEALALSLDANAHDLSQISGPTGRHDFGREVLEIAPDGLRRINIIADNFGGEFVADLILATVAAEAGIETIVHVKHLPIFVSDVTMDDLIILFDRLKPDDEFGRRVQAAVNGGRLRFASNSFWAAPKFLDRLPVEELMMDIAPGERVLNILKGDLNFRRAIGDATVPVDTPFEQLPVLPAVPLLALRSIKSYCVAGMADWPAGLSREDFPMDGAIVAAQMIPAGATVSA